MASSSSGTSAWASSACSSSADARRRCDRWWSSPTGLPPAGALGHNSGVDRRRTLLVAAALVAALSPAAHARSTALLAYPVPEIWPTAVRFIRVDRGYPVREKDEASGYILFELVEGAKSYKGSLELIHTV